MAKGRRKMMDVRVWCVALRRRYIVHKHCEWSSCFDLYWVTGSRGTVFEAKKEGIYHVAMRSWGFGRFFCKVLALYP